MARTTPDMNSAGRNRVSRACERCRLKKSKCDGMKPCGRCEKDGALCVLETKKKNSNQPHAKGYAELLEQSQKLLVRGLRSLYRRAIHGQGYPGEPLENENNGFPLTHSVLAQLGILDDYEEDSCTLSEEMRLNLGLDRNTSEGQTWSIELYQFGSAGSQAPFSQSSSSSAGSVPEVRFVPEMGYDLPESYSNDGIFSPNLCHDGPSSFKPHVENHKRAIHAACRQKDRSQNGRSKPAHQSSKLHKKLTGKVLQTTKDVVGSEESYEETFSFDHAISNRMSLEQGIGSEEKFEYHYLLSVLAARAKESVLSRQDHGQIWRPFPECTQTMYTEDYSIGQGPHVLAKKATANVSLRFEDPTPQDQVSTMHFESGPSSSAYQFGLIEDRARDHPIRQSVSSIDGQNLHAEQGIFLSEQSIPSHLGCMAPSSPPFPGRFDIIGLGDNLELELF